MKRTRHAVFPALLLFCCLAWAQAAFAQNIGLSVVGSAGDTKQHPDFRTLYWTVGEVAVEILEESQINLTQGFHQVFYIQVSDHGPAKSDWALKLFPNPNFGNQKPASASPAISTMMWAVPSAASVSCRQPAAKLRWAKKRARPWKAWTMWCGR